MVKQRFTPPAADEGGLYVFQSAEEAWIWGVQGMQARLAGGRLKSGFAANPKICEASDIIASAYRLRSEGTLTEPELQVMFLYGRHAVSPVTLGPSHRPAVAPWRNAMQKLGARLEQKGIISAVAQEGRHG